MWHYSIFDLGTRRDEESASRLGRTLTPGKTWYPFYRRLVGPQGRSGQVRKISPPPGFDPWTVQPVGSRYTDYATRPFTQFNRGKTSRFSPIGLICTTLLCPYSLPPLLFLKIDFYPHPSSLLQRLTKSKFR